MNKLNVFNLNLYSWRPINWGKNIRTILRSFKMAYQRITKGYCDWDLYNLDDYYAKFLSETLKEFAINTHTYPLDCPTDELWMERVTKLGSKFEMIARDIDDYNPFAETCLENKDAGNSYVQFYKIMSDKRNELIKESFRELGEIFNDLWD